MEDHSVVLACDHIPGGGGGVGGSVLHYSSPCWEAPPERGTFFKFLVCSV